MNVLRCFLPVFVCFSLFIGSVQAEIVVRAAIDIGSGATKLRIAQVDTETKKIIAILVDRSFSVPYQDQLDQSKNQTFDIEVMQRGLEVFQECAEIAKEYHAVRVVALATAAFRKARNGKKFISYVERDTGIDISVISQRLEGMLNFRAVMSQLDRPEDRVIVWDIGGGSLQFTTKDKEGDWKIYKGHLASIPFRNMIIEEVQKKNLKTIRTPNPMSELETKKSIRKAQTIASEVGDFFQKKMRNSKYLVVGVGSIFNRRIKELIGDDLLSKKGLFDAIKTLIDKTDEEVGGGDYANVNVSNPLLIFGFMKQLHIPKVQIMDVNGADGALISPKFWKDYPDLENFYLERGDNMESRLDLMYPDLKNINAPM